MRFLPASVDTSIPLAPFVQDGQGYKILRISSCLSTDPGWSSLLLSDFYSSDCPICFSSLFLDILSQHLHSCPRTCNGRFSASCLFTSALPYLPRVSFLVWTPKSIARLWFWMVMPYSIGLQSAANAFLSAGFATQFTISMITLLSILLIMSAFQKDAPDAPVSLPGLSLSHIIPFYKRRFDFLSWGIHATRQSVFQFKLLRVSLFWSGSFAPWWLMCLLSYFCALYTFTSIFLTVLSVMVLHTKFWYDDHAHCHRHFLLVQIHGTRWSIIRTRWL